MLPADPIDRLIFLCAVETFSVFLLENFVKKRNNKHLGGEVFGINGTFCVVIRRRDKRMFCAKRTFPNFPYGARPSPSEFSLFN